MTGAIIIVAWVCVIIGIVVVVGGACASRHGSKQHQDMIRRHQERFPAEWFEEERKMHGDE